MRKTKSAIFETVHETAKGLHAACVMECYAAQIRLSVSTAEFVLPIALLKILKERMARKSGALDRYQ
ncbi:MAG: hypothetical protein IPP88_21485 [Betaproteobacteria bacterium]|nr:hypothetical protein [Betaproteobacteria bacterium]